MNSKEIVVESEESRTYHYAGGSEFVVPDPLKVFVIEDERGVTHRVVSADGRTYRPERGWIGISWKPKSGEPPYIA
jgi:hypothetical protein